jgi:hypothetical protein
MMNNTFKTFTATCSVLLLLILNITNAKAQCSIVGVNSGGTTVTINISCDFPVFIDTGNSEADDANYAAQKESWIANHPDDYNALIGLEDVYYQIHQSDLEEMSTAKKSAILANTNKYHVIP